MFTITYIFLNDIKIKMLGIPTINILKLLAKQFFPINIKQLV